MGEKISDPILHPAHYEVYPVQPIQITRHLGFCLGNAVKYVLRAPYKGGVEDCDKALEYLRFENAAPQPPLDHFAYLKVRQARKRLSNFLRETGGDALWQDISCWQAAFLDTLKQYLAAAEAIRMWGIDQKIKSEMTDNIRELRRVLQLRDTTGQIYEGMTGLPQKERE